jgi:predicted PurR-regulated permease PerM
VRLAVAVVVVAALYVAQDVLIPIVLATMLSFVLSPLVELIERAGISRVPSVIVTVLLAFCVIAFGGLLMARQASAFASHAPEYAAAIEQKVQDLQLSALARLSTILRPFERAEASASPQEPTDRAREREAARSLSAPAERGGSAAVAPPSGSAWGVAGAILAPVLGPLETTVVVVVIAIFILLEREDLRDRVIRLAGSQDLQRTTVAMNDAARRLSRYFVSQVAVNTTFGVVIGTGLWIIGVPSAVLWGILAGLLRFIPYVGPVLAAIPPLAIALAVNTDWRPAVEVAALFVVVEPFTGYVVEPLLYGHSTGLAPSSVIVAAVFWTWIWGPLGLIISTPLTLCLVVLGRHVKSLEFFDVLLGDRPALTPADSFYQRMLANDPDGALERAEAMLQTQSFLDYSDTVMLPALRHAARDEARGAVTMERAAAVTRAAIEVIDELKDFDPGDVSDLDRPPGSASIVCASGRGTLDDAVTALLAHLLERRGFHVRAVPHSAVARDRVAQIDLAGVAAIVFSYLDMTGSATQLKYLVRRLRAHSSGVQIIVGLWPASDELVDRERLGAIDADTYATSLREAVEACLHAAA